MKRLMNGLIGAGLIACCISTANANEDDQRSTDEQTTETNAVDSESTLLTAEKGDRDEKQANKHNVRVHTARDPAAPRRCVVASQALRLAIFPKNKSRRFGKECRCVGSVVMTAAPLGHNAIKATGINPIGLVAVVTEDKQAVNDRLVTHIAANEGLPLEWLNAPEVTRVVARHDEVARRVRSVRSVRRVRSVRSEA